MRKTGGHRRCGTCQREQKEHVGIIRTVAEIKCAIEQLREVAAWLKEYQATINASAEVFATRDAGRAAVAGEE